ncbi:uncharacterized protein LOC114804419 [Zeugodacus cucurbitae]|uniref:uncharacterized protein LOC114804419 n=1 Tax=Zeugodacus cucurbitae TaxID=28588 RepID=UPI0010A74DBF|nr:uncharacterized protein LOC114804419 [Zeugodacus cucurbitae]
MKSSMLFVSLLLIATLLLVRVPEAESTIILLLCALRSPLCPFTTTTTTTAAPSGS